MSDWRDREPPAIKGLACYYQHRVGGRLRTVLYRPVRGPWTDTLKRRCPTAWRGRAKGAEEQPGGSDAPGDVTGDRNMLPLPARQQRGQSALRAELRARQGKLEL